MKLERLQTSDNINTWCTCKLYRYTLITTTEHEYSLLNRELGLYLVNNAQVRLIRPSKLSKPITTNIVLKPKQLP